MTLQKISTITAAVWLAVVIVIAPTPNVLASPNRSGSGQSTNPTPPAPHQCGVAPGAYIPSIDIGCKGKGNPIMDALFAIIRFLSDGVGIVVVASIVVGGIQYSASRGDPQSTARAVTRIRSAFVALLIFIFAYAMLNYLIPGAVLQ